MAALIAKYTADIPRFFFFAPVAAGKDCVFEVLKEEQAFTLPNFFIRDTQVSITLWSNPKTAIRETLESESYCTQVEKVKLTLTRNISEIIPTSEPKKSSFFSNYSHDYFEVVTKVFDSLMRYFQFELHHPVIEQFSRKWMLEPKWYDASGAALHHCDVLYITSKSSDAIRLGARPLEPNMLEGMSQKLETGLQVSLVDELLADAQSELSQRHIRHAVLGLAIACEVMVKHFFFNGQSTSSKVEGKVIELIDKHALVALGKSFKQEYKADYDNIDFLFRCRNKVAHRGRAIYRDDRGEVDYQADFEQVRAWLFSVRKLQSWLHAAKQSESRGRTKLSY